MTNQEILNTLSLLECALYYKADGSDDAENVKADDLWEMNQDIRRLLEKWHKLTGCTLQ